MNIKERWTAPSRIRTPDPVFEQAKTFNASSRAVTVIGEYQIQMSERNLNNTVQGGA